MDWLKSKAGSLKLRNGRSLSDIRACSLWLPTHLYALLNGSCYSVFKDRLLSNRRCDPTARVGLIQNPEAHVNKKMHYLQK